MTHEISLAHGVVGVATWWRGVRIVLVSRVRRCWHLVFKVKLSLCV
jgi:hypothetical protein